jgi:hypothetical protein
MSEALKELRKIAKMTDQKHWSRTEMRERALEEWIEKWILTVDYEQTVLNKRYLSSDFEDFLKEHVGKKLAEKAMEEAVEISTDDTKIKGKITCIRRTVLK